MDLDLKNKSIGELQKILTDMGERPFQAKNLFSAIHAQSKVLLDEVTTLSKPFRERLKEQKFYISALVPVKKLTDDDGTIKYLFELEDKLRIEAVLLDDDGRLTACISSQVGCKMECAFCATGKLRFQRNLNAAEIVSQVYALEKDAGKPLSNIVYMGMGEPLDNYTEVMKSVRMLNDVLGKNIGARHITISTCGLVPGIQKLAEEKIQIRLAVSIHAHIDKLRDELMPINIRYDLGAVMKAMREYQHKTGRRITIEYILLHELNDTREHARGLMNMLSGLKCHINLIEYNPYNGSKYRAPSHKVMKDFQWVLEDRGFETTMRFRRGQAIKAACGQLGSKID